MKAIFKLDKGQLETAAAMTAAVEGICLDGAYSLMGCGVYYVDLHQSTNKLQSVQLVGDTLVISGERCALTHDGGIAAALLILRTVDTVPVSYETSDARLRWHETLSGYICTRGTDVERVEYHCEKQWFLEPADQCALDIVLDNPYLAYAKYEKPFINALRRYNHA